MKNLFFISLSFVLLFVFSTCRKYKYPESTFKGDPSSASNNPFHGGITSYKVNGIDSLGLLDFYVDTAYSISKVGRTFKIRITECGFSNLTMRASYVDIGYGWADRSMAHVSYTFTKDKKNIKIRFENRTYNLHKNLFIDDNILWQIIKFTPNQEGSFKIKTTLSNGNTYEIQLNS